MLTQIQNFETTVAGNLNCFNDSSKISCNKRCAANESAVHIWLHQEPLCIRGFHASSILNGSIGGHLFTVFLPDKISYESMHFLGLLIRSNFTSTYGPYG